MYGKLMLLTDGSAKVVDLVTRHLEYNEFASGEWHELGEAKMGDVISLPENEGAEKAEAGVPENE